MPVYKPTRMTQLAAAVREWLPTVKPRLLEWWQQVREQPELVWQSVGVRCAVIVVAGLILLWAASFAVSLITPPRPANARPLSTTADIQVVCSKPACGHRFIINRKFNFDDFPVECPKCRGETGQRGMRCDSPTCRGKIVAPVRDGRSLRCSQCGQPLSPP